MLPAAWQLELAHRAALHARCHYTPYPGAAPQPQYFYSCRFGALSPILEVYGYTVVKETDKEIERRIGKGIEA